MTIKPNPNQIVREKPQEFLKKKNVVGVGVGNKNNTGGEAVVVLVEKKVPEAELSTKDVIPKEIDGVQTDVIEVGDIEVDSACTNCNRERPVHGGLSAIWEDGTACTLGAIVYKEGRPYALLNTHCAIPHYRGARIGDDILQPSPNDGGKTKDSIGKATAQYAKIDFKKPNNFDAALVALDVTEKPLYIEGIGDIQPDIKEVARGAIVKKSGRTTGVTESIVLVTNATVNVRYSGTGGKRAQFTGQTLVANYNRNFSKGGDSGSLILTQNNNPAGLYFAGSDKVGIFTPIQPIADYFNFTFNHIPKLEERYVFTKTLRRGAYGEEVRQLQKRLRKLGYFTYPTNTGYFGTITEKAVQQYQCDQGIVCSGNPITTGYGQVGRLTRAALNEEQTVSGLLPIVERMKTQLVAIMELLGQPIVVTSTYRSFAEQEELWKQGRSKPGDIITYARGGESMHNYRVAFDIAFITDTDDVEPHSNIEDITKELVEADAIHYKGDWELVGQVARELGLEWGGDWDEWKDRPHFEYTAGYTLQDFKEGRVDLTKFNDPLIN